MVKRIASQGFIHLLPLIFLLILLVGAVTAVVLLKNGTNLFSRASGGANVTVTGNLVRIKATPQDHYKLTQTDDGKEYQIFTQPGKKSDLAKYAGKRVIVKGRLWTTQTVLKQGKVMSAILVSQITMVGETELELVPTLGSNLGTASLQVSWPAADGAVISIKKASGQTISTFSPSPTETSHTFALTGLTNGGYYAELVLTANGQKVSSRQSFGYFEDGFEGNQIDSSRWTKSIGSGGSLAVVNGVIKMSMGSGGTTDREVFLQFKERLNNAFAGSVEYRDRVAGVLSFASSFLKFDNSGASPYVATEITRVSSADPGGIRWWTQGVGSPAERGAVQANVDQGKLQIVRSNSGNFREFYDVGSGWIEMTPAGLVTISNPGQVHFGVWSGDQHPAVSASFDNFRLIWVK